MDYKSDNVDYTCSAAARKSGSRRAVLAISIGHMRQSLVAGPNFSGFSAP
jgi:hypothetical protein